MWSENLANGRMVLFVWLLARFTTVNLSYGRFATELTTGLAVSRHLGPANLTNCPRVVYSSSQLRLIRKNQPKQHIDSDLWKNLGDLGIRKRFRGKRGGRNRNSIGISVAQSTVSPHSIVITNGAPTIRNPAAVPTLLVSNARSLAPKISELQCVAIQNSADIVCITETWLTDNIINDAVVLSGYNLFRKDRGSRGGGITVYISSSIRAKRLEDQELCEAVSESLWIELRPTRLPRPISAVLIGTVYHPPHAKAEDNNRLRDHIQEVVDSRLLQYPDCLVCVVGDFNPASTNFSASALKQCCGLTQIVRIKTRDTGILDWCLTNKPKCLSTPVQLPKLGTSDHYCFLVKNNQPPLKPSKTTITKRDTRASNIRSFGQWITSYSWDELYNLTSCKEKFEWFYSRISEAIDKFLPVRSVRMHATDKPWITVAIKSAISKRQRFLSKYGKESVLFKIWRNKVQRLMKECKETFYETKVKTLKETNVARWWKEVKNLSGVSSADSQWFHQLIGETESVASLCERINNFFCSLTSAFDPLTVDDVLGIPVDVSEVPADLFVTAREADIALRSIKLRKAGGPDGIPNIILKTFSFELAPVIADIYNTSLCEGYLPPLLKSAAVSPIPKERPPRAIESDLRPISLTCQISKVLESFTLTRMLPKVVPELDSNQFAVAGRSTDHALVYLLHLALEALDRGNCTIRFFFADFKKGFDLIDHKILLSKLSCFDLHPSLVRWVAAFLLGRSQFVQIGSFSSLPKHLNGGIPQGTKLAPLLFAIMVNDLVNDWRPRAKFVDDLTLLEVIPRNSPSVMCHIVSDVQEFASNNNMQLNPKKCKEMRVSFLHYNSCELQPIASGGIYIEEVTSFKLLGVYISNDLSWAVHCEYVVKKANRRLYAIRQLKKCRVSPVDLVCIYCSLVRSILEYACVVFANLPKYLSHDLERVQKRALAIIFPFLPYASALAKAGISTLEERRDVACAKFVSKIIPGNPLHPLIHSRIIGPSSRYNLRPKAHTTMATKTDRFGGLVSVKYAPALIN